MPAEVQELLQEGGDEDSDSEHHKHRKDKNGTLIEAFSSMCKRQSTLMNSFGNIIVNTGNDGIVGGDGTACITVSQDAAKLIAYWDHEVLLKGDSVSFF